MYNNDQLTQENAQNDMKLINGQWFHIGADGIKRKFDSIKNEWIEASEADLKDSEDVGSQFENNPNLQLVYNVWVNRNPDTGYTQYFHPEKQIWITPSEEPLTEDDLLDLSDLSAESSVANTPKHFDKDSTNEEEFDSDDDQRPKAKVNRLDEKANNEDDQFIEKQLLAEKKERHRIAKLRRQPNTHVCPITNTVYKWDDSMKAWTPHVDDDFLAIYQSQYGIQYDEKTLKASAARVIRPHDEDRRSTDPDEIDPDEEEIERKPEKVEKEKDTSNKLKQTKKKRKEKEGFIELKESDNRNVYVSNLPINLTEEEFIAFMSKCGVLDTDALTGQPKVKLYRDPEGNLKGDARCCYLKIESVRLAEQILDESEIYGKKVKVEQAKFEQKGNYDKNLRNKLTRKQLQKHKVKMEKYLDWMPKQNEIMGARPDSDKIMICKNVFSQDEIAKDATIIMQCQEEVKREARKYGKVKKVRIFENHPDGVAMVTYATAQECDDALTMMNFRMLRGRQLTAERWDGRTRYKVEETEEQQQTRIDNWHKYLEEDSSDDEEATLSTQ